MNIGVKTIGNATLIAIDKVPILSTDPWLNSTSAYFGSWVLSHNIPKIEHHEILESKYVWFSHGHPDHLNPSSINYFKKNKILLSDHYGNRIKNELIEKGFDVSILPDRKWTRLSKNIKVFSIADFSQNSILLIDVSNRLFVNLNDSAPRYWEKTVKRIISYYKESYLLLLFGWGDADMFNFFNENGDHMPTVENKMRNYGLGKKIYKVSKFYGVTNVIPFSCHHKYNRSDSAWANKYVPSLDWYKKDFPESDQINFIDAFVKINCENGQVENINPKENLFLIQKPEKFGDNWSDNLEKGDYEKINQYFQRKQKLNDFLGFLNFKIGKKDNFITLNKNKKTGITFEVPRNSLMQAIDFQIFDDLLIGNFMKTTVHNLDSLYEPNFNFIVTKWGDNGRVETEEEYIRYMKHYKRKGLTDIILTEAEKISMKYIRHFIPNDGSFGRAKRFLVHKRKKMFGKN